MPAPGRPPVHATTLAADSCLTHPSPTRSCPADFDACRSPSAPPNSLAVYVLGLLRGRGPGVGPSWQIRQVPVEPVTPGHLRRGLLWRKPWAAGLEAADLESGRAPGSRGSVSGCRPCHEG